jgi:hypothetical protein
MLSDTVSNPIGITTGGRSRAGRLSSRYMSRSSGAGTRFFRLGPFVWRRLSCTILSRIRLSGLSPEASRAGTVSEGLDFSDNLAGRTLPVSRCSGAEDVGRTTSRRGADPVGSGWARRCGASERNAQPTGTAPPAADPGFPPEDARWALASLALVPAALFSTTSATSFSTSVEGLPRCASHFANACSNAVQLRGDGPPLFE